MPYAVVVKNDLTADRAADLHNTVVDPLIIEAARLAVKKYGAKQVHVIALSNQTIAQQISSLTTTGIRSNPNDPSDKLEATLIKQLSEQSEIPISQIHLINEEVFNVAHHHDLPVTLPAVEAEDDDAQRRAQKIAEIKKSIAHTRLILLTLSALQIEIDTFLQQFPEDTQPPPEKKKQLIKLLLEIQDAIQLFPDGQTPPALAPLTGTIQQSLRTLNASIPRSESANTGLLFTEQHNVKNSAARIQALAIQITGANIAELRQHLTTTNQALLATWQDIFYQFIQHAEMQSQGGRQLGTANGQISSPDHLTREDLKQFQPPTREKLTDSQLIECGISQIPVVADQNLRLLVLGYKEPCNPLKNAIPTLLDDNRPQQLQSLNQPIVVGATFVPRTPEGIFYLNMRCLLDLTLKIAINHPISGRPFCQQFLSGLIRFLNFVAKAPLPLTIMAFVYAAAVTLVDYYITQETLNPGTGLGVAGITLLFGLLPTGIAEKIQRSQRDNAITEVEEAGSGARLTPNFGGAEDA